MKEKKTEQFSIRFEPSLADQIKEYAAAIRMEPKDFIREGIADLCLLIKNQNNELPEIVAMVREAQTRRPVQMSKPRKTA